MVQLWYFEVDGGVIGRMLIFINTTVSEKQRLGITDIKGKPDSGDDRPACDEVCVWLILYLPVH